MIFERLKKSPKPKQEDLILWSSASYFNQISNLDRDRLHQSLRWDIVSFLHEYVGMKDKKVYQYGINGIMDAYHQPTSQVCVQHEQYLVANGLEVTRAQFETKAALTLEKWMEDEDIPVGYKLVIISPRGKETEGYPGMNLENYVFINVYQKISEDDFQLVQYTSYAPERDLQQLQISLQQQSGGTIYHPEIETEDYQEIKPLNISHQIIDSPILLDSEVAFVQLEEQIYQGEEKWVTTRQDLPQLDEHEFNVQLEAVLRLLLTQFWLLAEQEPTVAITHFDILISIVREHFLKWVEDHAQNYQHETDLTPYALNLEMIIERWQLRIRKEEKKTTKEDEEKLKQIKDQIALNPLQPLMRASSVAHCIVGTPQSLAMQMMRMNPSLLSLSSSEFINMPHSEKKDLLEQIRTENMTEIILENGEVWMVPASFLDGKGCFVDENGVAMGPCDVPLEESFAFKMNQQEFNLFISELEQQVLMHEIDEVEEDLQEHVGLTSHLSKEIKEKVELIKKMIFKPIITITELISGDIIGSTVGQTREIRKIISKLRHANDPIKACDEIIKDLLSEQNGVLSTSKV